MSRGFRRHARSRTALIDFGPLVGRGTVRLPDLRTELEEGRQIVCGIRTRDGKREITVKGIDGGEGLVVISPAAEVRNGDRVE